MILHTSRLTLRRPQMADAMDLHRVMSNADAMRYWSTLPHTDLAVTEAWLARSLAHETALSAEFVILLNNHVIGTAGGYVLPSVGMILHPDYWGQGLAAEAMRAVLAHIFATFAADHLTADVDPRNAASLALLARLGFVQTGQAKATFLLGDEWCDSIYLTLPRDVWLQRSIGP